jgi:protein involved in polysaccharide export with SLBB domain
MGQAAPMSQYETRAQLEVEAKAAEKQGRTSEAWLLRSRLQKGDFQEGDRVVVGLLTDAKSDTLVVRAGKVLQIAGMADLSLAGVLRSELTETLRQHLARYLVNPNVRTMTLFPLTVLGNVGNPGFYYVSPDIVLRDVIMRAGGPKIADLDKLVIRRAGETIWGPADLRVALADGLSLDRLHLRAGDELFVPDKKGKRFTLQNALMVLSTTTTLYFLSSNFSRRGR